MVAVRSLAGSTAIAGACFGGEHPGAANARREFNRAGNHPRDQSLRVLGDGTYCQLPGHFCLALPACKARGCRHYTRRPRSGMSSPLWRPSCDGQRYRCSPQQISCKLLPTDLRALIAPDRREDKPIKGAVNRRGDAAPTKTSSAWYGGTPHTRNQHLRTVTRENSNGQQL